MPRIDGFQYDDENEDKFADHGLSVRQVDQVLDDEYYVARNRKGRRGWYLVIGKDHGGRCIAVPIEPTHRQGWWRPVTAWPCKDYERAKLD